MLKLINGRPFWLNALAAILLGFLLIFGALKMLGFITKHGDILTVPSVLNTNTVAAIKLLESKGFDVVIQDSTFTDTAKLGTVLKQFPDGNSIVKVNRTVLLTVNRTTLPMLDAPGMIGKSMDYALEIIERSHFKLGDTLFEPSYMQGAVISQNYKGAKLEPGAKILWGAKIDLVIGSGLSDRQFQVPNLLGLTFAQAKQILLDNRLILASAVADDDVTDSANAFVYMQYPPKENDDKTINYIREGQIMDLTLSKYPKSVSTTNSLGIDSIDEKQLIQLEKENEERQKEKVAREKLEKAEKAKLGKNKNAAAIPKVIKPKVPKVNNPKPNPSKPKTIPKVTPKTK